jgi:chromosome segregation ATPase
MHFSGFPRDTIARQLGISPATVSDILSILPPSLAPLRDLSKELRKNNMIARDAMLGVRILNMLRTLGVQPEQFSSSLQAVIKMSTDNKWKPAEVIQAGTKLTELEKQSGKPYVEAIKEFEMINEKTNKKKQQNKRLNARNKQLQTQIRKNEERQAQTFEAANVAPEEISKFKEQKAKIRQNGLKLNDYDTINNLLENVREAGGDAKQLVSLVRKTGSLKRNITDLQKIIEEEKRELASIKTQKETVELEFSQKHNQKAELENEIQSKHNILTYQNRQIQVGHAQLHNIRANLERFNSLRKEAIAQIGRWTGMDPLEIQRLQLTADFDLAYQSLYKRFKAFMDQRQKQLQANAPNPNSSDIIITIEAPHRLGR